MATPSRVPPLPSVDTDALAEDLRSPVLDQSLLR